MSGLDFTEVCRMLALIISAIALGVALGRRNGKS